MEADPNNEVVEAAKQFIGLGKRYEWAYCRSIVFPFMVALFFCLAKEGFAANNQPIKILWGIPCLICLALFVCSMRDRKDIRQEALGKKDSVQQILWLTQQGRAFYAVGADDVRWYLPRVLRSDADWMREGFRLIKRDLELI